MKDPVVVAFTAREVERLAGLTPKRLQYWDETGFITPSVAAKQGRGWPRLYSFQDLVQLRVAANLRSLLSLQALRKLKVALQPFVDAPFAEIRFGVTDTGEVVYQGPLGHREAAKAPGQIILTFDVKLREIRADLEGRIERMRQRRRRVGELDQTRGILSGRERVAGTRISVALLTTLLKSGWSTAEILEEYPDLRREDVLRAKSAAKAG